MESVDHYDGVRLHSAMEYVTPRGRMEGWHEPIHAAKRAFLRAPFQPLAERLGCLIHGRNRVSKIVSIGRVDEGGVRLKEGG